MEDELPDFNIPIFKGGGDRGKDYHLKIHPDQVSSYILSVDSRERMKTMEDILDDPVIIEGKRDLAVVTGYYKELYVLGFTTGMRPNSVAITFSDILSALWQRDLHGYIIRIGISESLQSYVKPGDFVISTGVVGDEYITSKTIYSEYPSFNDSIIYLALLKAAYGKGYDLGRNLHIGVVQSKDELYLYGRRRYIPISDIDYNRFLAFEKIGVLAAGMESSVYPIYRDYYNYLVHKKGLSSRIYVGSLLLILSGYWRSSEAIEVDDEILKERKVDEVLIALKALRIIDKFFKREESLDNYLRMMSTLHGAMI